jgi:RNA polymerase sigma-70 factor (ECF subfamily)
VSYVSQSSQDAEAARRASFEEEALPHLDAVYRFALRLAGSSDAAEDLVQETFYRAYRSWDQYTLGTRSKSWLFTICRNVFLRQRERRKRHDEILTETVAAGPPSVSRENPVFAASRDEDPEGDFFKTIVDEEVLSAIDDLQEEYRTAVVLSDLQGLSYAEISEVMEVPVGTVKSRLFRGRQRLQNKLYDYAVEMGYLKPRAAGEAS